MEEVAPVEASHVTLPRVEEVFSPGTSVSLHYSLDRIVRSHRSRVEDLTDDALILLAPETRGIPERVPAGTEVTLLARRQAGSFAATVVAREVRPGSPALLVVSRPKHVEKTSQRQFFRVEVDLPVSEGDVTGRIVNLSGSGCLLVTSATNPSNVGTKVRLVLSLPGTARQLPVTGIVVRSDGAREEGQSKIGIEFVELHENTQDAIVRYLMKRQAELIRLGLAKRTGHTA
jgi:c-di-GMP-binding flagellar brake protein YcgR